MGNAQNKARHADGFASPPDTRSRRSRDGRGGREPSASNGSESGRGSAREDEREGGGWGRADALSYGYVLDVAFERETFGEGRARARGGRELARGEGRRVSEGRGRAGRGERLTTTTLE